LLSHPSPGAMAFLSELSPWEPEACAYLSTRESGEFFCRERPAPPAVHDAPMRNGGKLSFSEPTDPLTPRDLIARLRERL